MVRFLWICLGGAVGTGARYLLSGWTARRFGTLFPSSVGLVLLTYFVACAGRPPMARSAAADTASAAKAQLPWTFDTGG